MFVAFTYRCRWLIYFLNGGAVKYIFRNLELKTVSHCITQAGLQCLFTGAILLLSSTGALTSTVSPRFRGPGGPRLPQEHHIHTELSTDTQLTSCTAAQNSWAQAIRQPQPPSSLDYNAPDGRRCIFKSFSRRLYCDVKKARLWLFVPTAPSSDRL